MALDNSKNTKKLHKGERIRKDGRYEYRYRNKLGQDHSVYGTSLAELRQREEEISRLRFKGVNLDKANVSLDDLFDLWRENKKGIKKNTFSNYIYMYKRYVYGKFGKNKIRDMSRSDIKRFYNDLYDKKHLSAGTIDSIHTVIHQVIEIAIDDDYIRYNPADKALTEIKKEAKKKKNDDFKPIEPKFLNSEEKAALFEFLKTNIQYNRWYYVLGFLIMTGVRIGEFAALQKEDVDYENRTITINKTLASYEEDVPGKTKRKTLYEIHSTKTEDGNRVIPMNDEIEQVLRGEEEYQKFAELKCVRELNGYKNFMFLTSIGTFYKDCTVNKAIYRIIKACNEETICKGLNRALLPKVSCHKFRHTFNSDMHKLGIMVEDRIAILGQKDVGVNIDVYTHVADESKRATMEKMSSHYKESGTMFDPTSTQEN